MTDIIREYDVNGKLVHSKYSNGYEVWSEYDNNGNCIHYKNSDGFEWWREYEYDGSGNLIHCISKYSTGLEVPRKYGPERGLDSLQELPWG